MSAICWGNLINDGPSCLQKGCKSNGPLSMHPTKSLLEQTINWHDIQWCTTYKSKHKTNDGHFDDFGMVRKSKSINGAIVCKPTKTKTMKCK